MEINKFQIVFFPYLFLTKFESIKLLGVTIWNSKEISNRIKNEDLKNKIITLIEQNRIFGKPIQDIGIVNFRGWDDFRPLTVNEERIINEIRIVLFLSGVAKCNTNSGANAGHYMLTSDNFKIVYQNFKLDSPYTGYSSGRIVRLSDFGYEISKITYEKPPYILKNSFSYDENLLSTLERLKRKRRKSYRLILRASDALMNAYTNSEDVSFESRILELSRAFEILFKLPEKQQRKVFKDAIKKYCEPAGERMRRYLSERPRNIKVPERGSRQVMWADRFYTLRNHIIHGESVAERGFWFYGQPHYQLGLWFFLVSIKRMINESLGTKNFYDFVKCEDGCFVYHMGSWRKATAEILQALMKKGES